MEDETGNNELGSYKFKAQGKYNTQSIYKDFVNSHQN